MGGVSECAGPQSEHVHVPNVVAGFSPRSRSMRALTWYYLLSLPLTVCPINLLYSAKSVGEQSISLTSKLGVCKSKRNRSSATQGFVYIFGSSIFTVSSK